MSTVIKIIAAVISGVCGGMGLGGGTVLMLYLSAFTNLSQKQMQGVNLIFFLPVALCSIIILLIKKQIVFKPVLIMLPCGIIGCVVSGLLLPMIKGAVLTKGFAVLLIIIGVKELFLKSNIRS